MLLLAKLFGILTLIWFYISARKHGGPWLNWSIIGLIGYWLTWWLAKYLVLVPLADVVPKHSAIEFLLTQSPVAIAVTACFFIRNKLINSLAKSQ